MKLPRTPQGGLHVDLYGPHSIVISIGVISDRIRNAFELVCSPLQALYYF